MVTVVILSALREARLEVYVSLFAVCYFMSLGLFQPRRQWFDIVGAVLILTFCYIIAMKVLEILF